MLDREIGLPGPQLEPGAPLSTASETRVDLQSAIDQSDCVNIPRGSKQARMRQWRGPLDLHQRPQWLSVRNRPGMAARF